MPAATSSHLGLAQSSGDPRLDRRYGYAEALDQEGDLEAAMDLYRQIVVEAPHWVPAWMGLAAAAERSGNRSQAVLAYRAAAAQDTTGMHGAALHVARLSDERSEPAMAPSYVAALFDSYAPRFDIHLVGALNYNGPEVIATALATVEGDRRFARALDLGCGTGLMGRAIRPRVEWLGGIDLSAAMVAQAERSGAYDTLAVASVADALGEAAPASLDLVLAADVFVYLGALDDTLAAVARALHPGGVLAFTVQKGDDAVRLGDDLRVSHSPDYIAAALARAGLTLALIKQASTRREAGQPVPGLVVVAHKP